MPAKHIIKPYVKNSYYHIYNRGVNKELIFFSERNYQFFIYKMVNYMQDNASILAYCLMPNHYHLLVKIKNADFVQKGLQPFLISFTNSINGIYLSRAQLNYKLSENSNITLQFRSGPGAYYDPYGFYSGYHRNSFFDDYHPTGN